MADKTLRCAVLALMLLSAGAAGAAGQATTPASAPTGARAASAADGRVRLSLNTGWRYHAGGLEYAERPETEDAGWEPVNLPHTWNAHDPFDDVPGYRRGISWYRRKLELAPSLEGKRVFLYFEGANQVADVYVNGAFVGEHRGGYTAFAFDITRWLRFGPGAQNVIAVKVNNAQDPFIAPLSVGYALYGGIYRDVWLLATDPVHLAVTDHAGPGVRITTPAVSRDKGEARVRATLVNDAPTPASARVVVTLTDPAGAVAGTAAVPVTLKPGSTDTVQLALPPVAKPKLWSPDAPNLYTVRTEVLTGERVADRLEQPLGFRWYRIDPADGFFLNGQHLALHGTNRHQDMAGLGSALSDEQHLRDLEWVKDMGANFLRLAHYPQDPAVLEAADRLGLIVWEEIPVVNYITPGQPFTENARGMLLDMIRQHANHPSVVMWGLMNEVFLWGPEGKRIREQTDTTYTRQVREFAQTLNATAHAEDPTRLTTMALHGSADYDQAGVAAVTDVVGVNRYDGWYSGVVESFGRGMDRRHQQFPRQPLMISEYGAGTDTRLNALEPVRFDHSTQYQRLYHESYLRQIRARPYLFAAAIWNEFDFSQPFVGGPLPQMNIKGMLTFDRRPKDIYYLYQANWTTAPMVRIASHDWTRRAGVAAPAVGASDAPAGATVTQPVEVYSNQPSVELFLDGRPLGAKTPDDVHKAVWQVPFAAGRNTLVARAGAVTDQVDIDFQLVPADLRASFRELAVNVGSSAQFSGDGATGPVWLQDQPWRAGSFGFVGGQPAQFDRDVPITGTDRAALFFSFREGLEEYRADVPDGDYDVELLFAEPEEARAGDRVFTVNVNGQPVAPHLDLAAQYGARHAVTVRFPARVTGGAGLRVGFVPEKGKTILCALKVTKR